MAIVEFQGGRITARYLMNKRKFDLLRLVQEYQRIVGDEVSSGCELDRESKSALTSRILRLCDRVPE